VSSTVTFFNPSTPGSPFATFSVPPLAAGAAAGPFTAIWISPSLPGTYQIVAAVDSGDTVLELGEANNRYTWNATVYPPPITSLSFGLPNYGGTYVTSATPLNLSVLDRSGTGIARTEYRIGAGPWISYMGPFTLVSEGEHVVEWFSEDNVGNVEGVQGMGLRVDNTPPTTNYAVAGPSYTGGFVSSFTRVSLTTTDGGVLPVGIEALEYSFDGQTWIPYSVPFGLSGDDGPKSVYFRGRDLLGNSEPVRTLSLILDNTPPTTVLAVPSGTLSVISRLALTATDSGSGVALIEYSIDGGVWVAYAGPFVLTPGDHMIRYRSVDPLGNPELVRTTAVRIENWKPLVALGFGVVLLVLGVVLGLLRTASNDSRLRGKAFIIGTVPFVVAEAITGILSSLTGTLAIPPILDAGVFVDSVILGVGLVVAIPVSRWVRKHGLPAPPQ
jgi:hypothetical protein